MKKTNNLSLLFAMLAIAGISACESPEYLGQLDGAISSQKIRAHLKLLSDDIMEGRAPGSRGSELAAKYIASQFEAAGLLPAVGDSSYFQNVELTGFKSTPSMNLRGYGRFWRLGAGSDFVAWNQIEQPLTYLRNKEIIFMGYGIHAPEFNWSDYEGVDVTGKVLLILVNEPIAQSQDFFDGHALTYYGRWTYKFEEAARRGAEGVILIHTPALAGYGWNVVQSSRSKELFFVKPAQNTRLLNMHAWISEAKASEVLTAAGFSLNTLIEEAGSSSFKAKPLLLRVYATIQNEIRTLQSPNVIAKIKGSDPALKTECIVYTSHYDHLGAIDGAADDGIFNGALDNASGTAALLEIARGFSQSPLKTKRSLIFAAVTAEESGLLGSSHYVNNPVFPLEKTSANINVDAVNVWGKTKDIIAIGAKRSSIYSIAQKVAHEMNVRIMPDPNPEKGIFFRSDQFSFVKMGVPAVYIKSGVDYVGKPKGWGAALLQSYAKERYHGVLDEYDPTWSLKGAAQVAQFALKTGYYLANAIALARWQPEEQFRRRY